MCLMRCEFCENLAPQVFQGKVYVDMYHLRYVFCLFKMVFCEILAAQILPIKGFSPQCNAQISLCNNLTFSSLLIIFQNCKKKKNFLNKNVVIYKVIYNPYY